MFNGNLPRYFDASELATFEAFLDTPRGEYFFVEVDGRLVACGGFDQCDHIGSLSWGMVIRPLHGTSIGKFLLTWRVNALFDRADVSSIVIDTSQHTEGFFERHGFRRTRMVLDGFGPGIDHVSMSLSRKDWRERSSPSRVPAPNRGVAESSGITSQ